MAQIPANLPPSLQLLLQKQQEHSGLQALREASGDLVKRVEKLAESTNVMADGGKAIGDVMQNWSYVWTILEQLQSSAKVTEEEGPEPVPQLVRLAYKEVDGGEDGQRPADEGREVEEGETSLQQR